MSKRGDLYKRADSAVSKYVRAITEEKYGGCPFCNGEIQCCFHFIRRGYFPVRFNLDNLVGSCFACNGDMENNPVKYIQWFYKKRSKKLYNELMVKGYSTNKLENYELDEIRKKYEKKLTTV